MKIRFNSDGDLPVKTTLKLRNMRISFRSVFHKGDIPKFSEMNACTINIEVW